LQSEHQKTSDSLCIATYHPTWINRRMSKRYRLVFLVSWNISQLWLSQPLSSGLQITEDSHQSLRHVTCKWILDDVINIAPSGLQWT